MASKVMVVLPASTTFNAPAQGNLERRTFPLAANDHAPIANESSDTNANDITLRVHELEKTIKFLKEDQKRMLSYLHQEIASLQNKNRDLLCQLIFKGGCDLEYSHNLNDANVKYILMSHDDGKTRLNNSIEYSKETESSNKDVFELKYTVDQQEREIEYLKGQLELISLRNKTQNQDSRRADNYIREMEERQKDQEKLVRLLRKENKEQKQEIENLRKTLNNVRMNNHVPQNIQVTRVQAQNQMFPPIRPASTFWCQDRSIPITDYQLQRTSISASGAERASTSMPGISFTLPPVCSYRQVAVTAPPRFYTNGNYYYTLAQRPMLRNKSYSNENGARSPNKNIQNGSNI